MKLFEELKWRGLVQDISNPELEEKLNNEKLTFYIGTDPTADSMHIGHYSSFLICKRLAKAGHHPILLVGGATGLIGDPKPTAERPMISKEEVLHNFEGLKSQAEKVFGFEVVNNFDWIKDINVIDFLRDYGKYFNINYMLAKDKVKSRLESGITYAEFSYMILQALDFLHLYEERGVTLQVAGSDQWGNITSGIELVRKKLDKEVYGMVMPLVTDSNGVKFGKTEGNALWLDKSKTPSYELYQYLINTDDACVIDYLKKLTFLEKDEIEKIEKEHKEKPELRMAQKKLAEEVITFLHGKDEYLRALNISECLFSEKIWTLKSDEILNSIKDIPTFDVSKESKLIEVLVDNNICASKREAREMISGNAISINNKKINDVDAIITKDMAIDEKVLLIKKGKKSYYLGILK